MDSTQAKRTVVVSMVGVGTLSLIGQVAAGETDGSNPPTRLLVGTAVAGIVLAVLAEFVPWLAGGVAIVALCTSVFVLGGPAWDSIAKLMQAKGK